MTTGTNLLLLLAASTLLAPHATVQTSLSWSRAWPKVSPRARSDFMMAYDSTRKRIVLFGGLTKTKVSSETWEWTGSTWQPAIWVKSSPPAMYGIDLVYDPLRKRTILYDIKTGFTWEYDGLNWTKKTSSITPPKSNTIPITTWHAGLKKTILFDHKGQTWAWDGTNWSLLTTPIAPPSRLNAEMVYQDDANAILLFGGFRLCHSRASRCPRSRELLAQLGQPTRRSDWASTRVQPILDGGRRSHQLESF